MTHPHRPTPCPWSDSCTCTHDRVDSAGRPGRCVGGWIDHEKTRGGQVKDVATPCPNCRPDLAAEMTRRGHVAGEDSTWMRTMRRPIADAWAAIRKAA